MDGPPTGKEEASPLSRPVVESLLIFVVLPSGNWTDINLSCSPSTSPKSFEIEEGEFLAVR